MVIGVCGYGYTGSGAVLDLFRDYTDFSQCEYDDVELMMCYYPDGLESLAFHLFDNNSRFMSSDIAVYRFEKFMYEYARSSKVVKLSTHGKLPEITEAFLEKIVDISWDGSWLYDFFQNQDTNFGWFYSRATRTVKRRFEKMGIDFPKSKKRKMRLVTDREKFYCAAKEFMRDIINEIHPNCKERVVLNQPFASNYPTKSFKFFDDPKAIIVDRDPRDVYLLSKRAVKSRSEWIPTDDVSTFVKYYRYMHDHLDDAKQRDDVLIVRFEDLIYHTDETIKLIEGLVGEMGPKNSEKHFDPKISRNNTQLFKKYTEYGADIAVIEEELKEYLYDFSSVETPLFDSEVF